MRNMFSGISRHFLLGIAAAAAIATAHPAAAEDSLIPPTFTERDVRNAITEALQAMPQVKCGGEPCPAPTAEEYATPPVEVDEARFALRTGAKSALLSWCGLDWQSRAYSTMMRTLMQKYKPDDRGLQVLKMIHALQLGRDFTNRQMLKTCSPETRAELEAQNPSIIQEVSMPSVETMLRDDSVARMLQLVLDRLPEALCGPKQPCAPATAEEKAKPPVSIEDARTAMTAGLLSATAQHCGLDWQKRVFGPFMAHNRHTVKMSDRQLAIMGVLHGTMQGYIQAGLKQRGDTCTAEMRADIEKKIAKP